MRVHSRGGSIIFSNLLSICVNLCSFGSFVKKSVRLSPFGRLCFHSPVSGSLPPIASMKIQRRHFFRTTGISLALPWLEAFAVPGANANGPARRMICICAPLGLHPDYFFPAKTGRDYELSPHLEIVKEFRDQFTVI